MLPLAATSEGGDLLPVIGTTADGAEGDDDDVQEEVTLAAVETRIAESGEVPGDREWRWGHASPP